MDGPHLRQRRDGAPVLRTTGLGPRFAAVAGRPAGWTAASALFEERLDAHLLDVGVARGATPAVAGTVFLQQYAALLASPVLAALYVEQAVLGAAMAQVSVSCTAGMAVQLAFAEPPQPVPDPASARDHVLDELLGAHLGSAAEAVHRSTRAGRRVLRGAIANEVATAFLHLSWRHPDRAHHVTDARECLAAAGLADLVDVTAVETGGTRWFYAERRTCCLAFRSSHNQDRPEPYCAICPIVPRSTSRAMFEEAAQSYQLRNPPRA